MRHSQLAEDVIAAKRLDSEVVEVSLLRAKILVPQHNNAHDTSRNGKQKQERRNVAAQVELAMHNGQCQIEADVVDDSGAEHLLGVRQRDTKDTIIAQVVVDIYTK